MALTLPPELTKLAEDHACFSGCWDRVEVSAVVLGPGQIERVITVHCSDCLTYRIGASAAQLGPGPYTTLAAEVSAHVHARRDYGLALSGYHLLPGGNGFWLSAAWLPRPGVFLLAADRKPHTPDAVPRLIDAFRLRVAGAPAAGMLDANNYRTHDVWVRNLTTPLSSPSVAALFASGQVSTARRAGFQPVTLAEYLPMTTVPPARPARVAVTAPPAPKVKQLGDRCDVCGELVEHRSLVYSTYIGCACG